MITMRHHQSRPRRYYRHVVALQVALGAIWLLDGALQCQPFMFTRGFVRSVLLPSAAGNPGFVARPTLFVAGLIAPHIALWNTLFATAQLAMGAGIAIGALARRRWLLRASLAGSFVWSLMVWWLAEGLGGVLAGGSPLSGAPGAVSLYVVAGLLVWPGNSGEEGGTGTPLHGARFAKSMWLTLWALNAFLLLEPDNQAEDAVSSLVSQAAAGEPGALHRFLVTLAGRLGGAGPWVDSVMALLMLLIGIGVAFEAYPRLCLGIAVFLGGAIWVFGEAFGGILTGQGTDVNTGPLLVLIAFCMWVALPQPPVTPSEALAAQNGLARSLPTRTDTETPVVAAS